jgi:hypothetical protein
MRVDAQNESSHGHYRTPPYTTIFEHTLLPRSNCACFDRAAGFVLHLLHVLLCDNTG